MAESSGTLIDIPAPGRLQITKWKVRKGSKVSQGSVLGFYQLINSDDPEDQDKIKPEQQELGTQLSSPNNQLHKLKASHVGTVSEIIVEEGQEIVEGSVVLQIKGCSHPTVMKDMCADCGADLRTEMGVSGYRKKNISATVAMVHSIPELIVSEEQALELGRADEIRLKNTRKLVLLVDLDQTLIHTTNDNIPPNLKGIHHFQLWQGMNLLWYHTRIRPHTQQFLENISKLYELHICTFGVRMYAHTIARFIDPAGKFFSHRILSRDECFNAMSKTANLKALFPCGDSMVCIIDDREDVWNFAPNLIHVKPYRFFQGTADINAPPGLSKKENDSKPITRHVRKVSANSNSPEKGKGMSAGSKDKDKTSKNIEKEKKAPEESSLQKCKLEEEEEEKNVTVDSVSKEEEEKNVTVDSVSKEEEEKNVTVDSVSKEEEEKNVTVDSVSKEEEENVTVDSVSKDEEKNVTVDSVSKEEEEKNVTVDSVSKEEEEKNVTVDSVSKEEEEKNVTVDSVSKEEEEKNVTVDSVSKEEEENVTVDSVSKEEEENVTVDSVSKEEDSDAVSKEQDISMASKDNADDNAIQPEKNDAENLSEDSTKEENTETVESKEEESKSDEEDGAKAEDLEGLSEDSSMSGMSLCDNSSTNAASKNDDSNVDENDDDDNDNEDEIIEWEDEDDYLFYLEEILQRIHTAYFDISDQLNAEGKASEINLDLKAIIPYVKRKVLKGCNICFSGVIPLNTPVAKSRAYNVALSLGANVHDTFVPYSSNTKLNYTTHLIANKMGTSKVNAAKRARKVVIVSLDWLWSCAERWDHVDEKLFHLKEKDSLDSDNGRSNPEISKESKSASRKRKSRDNDKGFGQDDVFSPESKVRKIEESDSSEEQLEDEILEDVINNEGNGGNNNNNNNNNNGDDNVKKLKRTGSRYNPLYSFSDEERASMDKELEELMDEDDSSDEEEAEAQLRKQILHERKCDTSSEDSLSGEFPHGWKSKKWSKRRLGKKKVPKKRDESIESEDSEASISAKYEKSIEVFAAHVSDSSNEDSDCESIGSIDEEIAEAVEKEFLAR